MALSDVEIWMELQANSLVIDPMPAFEDVAAASIDLHLAPELDAYKPNPGGWKIDLRDANASGSIKYGADRLDLTKDEFWLAQGNFAIGYVRERVEMPAHLLGRIEGRSSFARLGIQVHNTAPTIQPNWGGHIALELTNVSPIPVRLSAGLIICQLVVERLGRPTTKPYTGQFPNQKP
jgi:dCTP deaminase